MHRPKSKSYYFAPIHLPRRTGSTRGPSLTFDGPHVPQQPSGLLARIGFNLNPQPSEKFMEPGTIKNRLAVPLNFQSVNFSSGIPIESISFLQEESPATTPELAVEDTVLPAKDEENALSPTPEGPTNLGEIFPVAETSGATVPGDRLFQLDSESEGAAREIEAPFLWSSEGEIRNSADTSDIEIAHPLPPAPFSESPEFTILHDLQDSGDSEIDCAHEGDGLPEYWTAEVLGDKGNSKDSNEMHYSVRVPASEEPFVPPTFLSFHGLRQQPFDVTPDPSYLYFSPSHREALISISEGVEHFRGFMALIAEPGMGKTTLLNKLMEELSATARVVFLFQTQCTSSELLAFFLNELEVDHAGMDVVAMHRALNQVLLEEMLRGRRFVLIVDEAQNLHDSVLETIRLLSDFETAHSKLIQIVLAGQPQLVDTLLRPNLVQLRQRIAILSSLKALNAIETTEYIEHRLRAAGWNGHQIFTPEALETIAQLSGGVPRTINNLCFNAMLKAFTRRQEIIDTGIVKEVTGSLNLAGLVRREETIEVQQVTQPTPQQPSDTSGTAQLAQAISAAIAVAMQPQTAAETAVKSQLKPGAVITGKLIEKLSVQSWSKKHEFRIAVSFERDPIAGIPVADRHYCCNFYIGEEEAANLQVGKPVRIRMEQE